MVRAQAALEFLMTYGWAFLLMIAVVGSYVVFDPLGNTPEIQNCDSTNPLIQCDQDRVRASTEGVEISLQSGNQEAVTVKDVEVTTVNEKNISAQPCRPQQQRVAPGERIQLQCANLSGIITQEGSNQVEVEFESYKTEVGSDFAQPGSINLRFVPEESSEFLDYVRELIWDFEDGTRQGWIRVGDENDDFHPNTTRKRGSYSAFVNVEGSQQPKPLVPARLAPSELIGGKNPDYVEFYYNEDSYQYGGGVALIDSEGNEVLGVATNNPELYVHDNYGWDYLDYGSYDTWYRVRIDFNWTAGTADVIYEDTSTGFTNTYEDHPLRHETNIEKLKLKNFGEVQWQRDRMIMWFDDFTIAGVTRVPLDFALQGDVEKPGGEGVPGPTVEVRDDDGIYDTIDRDKESSFRLDINASKFTGETAQVTATTTGYDDSNTKTVDITTNPDITLRQDIIDYEYNVTTQNQTGGTVQGATVKLDDGSDPSENAVTNTTGQATVFSNIETGVNPDDTISLSGEKTGYNSSTTTVVADPDDRSKDVRITMPEKDVTIKLYDFEDNTLQNWTKDITSFETKSNHARGSYSVGAFESSGAPSTIAHIIPQGMSGGKEVQSIEFYARELQDNRGGGFSFKDSNGDEVLGVATTNPQWVVNDGDDYWEEIWAGEGYKQWIRVKVAFDWDAGTADITVDNLDGTIITSNDHPLQKTTNIEELAIRNHDTPSTGWSYSSFYMWIDDVTVVY